MTTIKYCGHSCFLITCDNGYRYVLDPYEEGSVPGAELPDLEAEEVLCSHEHGDHGAAHRVKLSGKELLSPLTVSYLLVPHDDQGGALRGMNRIYILEGNGMKIAHYGDLGRDLTEEETERLSGCDAVMIPCGGHYTIDAAQTARIVKDTSPKLAILMHFRTDRAGYGVLAHINDVKEYFPEAVSTGTDTVNPAETTGVVILDPAH